MRPLIAVLGLLLSGCGAAPPPVAAPGLEGTLLGYLDLGDREGRARSSRSQAVFLRSIAVQHPGLRVRTVDVSGLAPAARRDRALAWDLAGLRPEPLSPRLEPWFRGVVPTVVLFDREGGLVQRWEGFVPAAVLGPLIRSYFPTSQANRG